jgi:hypothetical protein
MAGLPLNVCFALHLSLPTGYVFIVNEMVRWNMLEYPSAADCISYHMPYDAYMA